ncbi:hypothetical protein [Bacillus cereus]|nr:hypothetical protein [Bacillus cereus]
MNMHQRQELSLFAEESYRYMFFVIRHQLPVEGSRELEKIPKTIVIMYN